MTTGSALALAGVLVIVALTLVVGAIGLRVSRTTSDFYVASRTVGPGVNAAAISGEYLSAASFLGVAGLILVRGIDMVWYPVGWTAGYLLLLLFVAAPLRRSRAYTLPDFAEFRLESSAARGVSSALVVMIAVLYLIPQFRGAGLTLHLVTGAPSWLGSALVAVVVLLGVAAGGMRSITLGQAVQYWVKLAALLTPLVFLLISAHGGSTRVWHRIDDTAWLEPLSGDHALYLTYSLIVATFLGTMGLPHVVVRFYTNRDGAAARRTTVNVLALLSLFYLLPPAYGVLGRRLLGGSADPDSALLSLPDRAFGGMGADLLTAVLASGAFAAFLSTSSGLVLSLTGVLSQDVVSRGSHRLGPVASFRVAAVGGALVTLVLTWLTANLAVAHAVELAFAVSASTFAPLLILGIWWRGLTSVGAIAGLVVGGLASGVAVVAAMAGYAPTGLSGAVLAQPASLTVPLTFLVMVGVSLVTPRSLPPHVVRTMVRLHMPESVAVDRSGFRTRVPED
ncbi:cation acetate symporter [Nocardioides sp. Kera G14]|uniref:sodium/solute symporter n=1 Tax=Nocardioides sp. Kera G14 TaxID=2884264 RepID=UPI001D1104F2|nr:cation acetate symporter [Nocardioides sp. Kera G14]UDY23784.1 cation acetate symporter [Nocardioides sp. Kera G14]